MQRHGVEKTFWVEQVPVESVSGAIVFFCRPTTPIINVIIGKMCGFFVCAHNIAFHPGLIRMIFFGKLNRTCTLVFVPRLSRLILHILEKDGVLSNVSIKSFPFYFINLEEDLISLENEDAFRDIWLVSGFYLSARLSSFKP